MTTRAQFKAFEFLQVKGMKHEDLELYASAPELLEAVKAHIEEIKNPNSGRYTRLSELEALVAKAEGR